MASEGEGGLKPLVLQLVDPSVVVKLVLVGIVGPGPGLDVLALTDDLLVLVGLKDEPLLKGTEAVLTTGSNKEILAECGRGNLEDRQGESGLWVNSEGTWKDIVGGDDNRNGVSQGETVETPHEERLEELCDLGVVNSTEIPSAE